mgnify:CR=1 FL=1
MLLNCKKRKNEKGFAIALALLMLVAMSLMGATLMVVAAGDHKRNGNLNIKQQTFYAAETGITEAKKWLASETSLAPGSGPGNNLSFFPYLLKFFFEISTPASYILFSSNNKYDNVGSTLFFLEFLVTSVQNFPTLILQSGISF